MFCFDDAQMSAESPPETQVEKVHLRQNENVRGVNTGVEKNNSVYPPFPFHTNLVM